MVEYALVLSVSLFYSYWRQSVVQGLGDGDG